MTKTSPRQLHEIVESNRQAFEEALNEMAHSGFGELEGAELDPFTPSQATPAPRDELLTFPGY